MNASDTYGLREPPGVPHAAQNYRGMMSLPHLHMTHWHQMWLTVCFQQPVEIQTFAFLKMPGKDLKENVRNLY